MKPIVSVIVPIYQVAPYLSKCIESIMGQTFGEFELILVNDGSPDESGEICEKYAQTDTRIRVIHKCNGGVSSARNVGLSMAKGDYVVFVDGDDYIDVQMLAILYQQAQLHDSDMVVCDLKKVNHAGELLDNKHDGKEVRHFTNIEALQQMFVLKDGQYTTKAGNNVVWVIITAKMYSKHLFKDIKFTEGMICEDEMIAHELLFRSEEITYIPSPLYYYVQRKNSTINSPFTIKRFDKVYALKERTVFFREKQLYELHCQAMKSCVDAFFWNYTTARRELNLSHSALKKFKQIPEQIFRFIITNPLISWKQKVFIFLFIIYPQILDRHKQKQLGSKNTI
jgi:glycosyltransferase involved in cell wall biosynthesis